MAKQLYINALLAGMIITGSLNTLVYKYQNTTTVDGVRFNHPYMQALAMFVGEALCIVLFFCFPTKDTPNPDKLPPTYKVLAIPAAFDAITSSLQHIALNFIPSSIYQMLRGGVIVVTAFFSIMFLNKKLTNQQWTGITLTLFGIFIVGLSNFIFASASTDDSFVIQMISIGLVIISLFSQAGIYVAEEKIFQKYNMDTFMMVGGEGMWGLVYFAVLMPILNFIPCNFQEGCVFKGTDGYMERTDVFFEQLLADGWLALAVVLGILSIALFNLCGVSVTKNVSAVARTVIDAVRTIVIWGVGLLVTQYTDRKWENTSLYANLLELFGYVFLVLGNLVYKDMVKLPWFGTKKQVQLLEEDKSITSLQPS